MRFIRVIFLVLSIMFISAGDLLCDTSPFQFLRINSSARAAALGGAFVSVVDDPNAVFYNPATISTVKDKDFSTTFMKNVLDINSGLVTYLKQLPMGGTLSGEVSYINYGSFDGADNNGNARGTFGSNNLSLGAAYSNELDSNLYYGIAFNLMFINIEKFNSFAFGIDAGLLYLLADKRTNVGVSILHAGSELKTLDGLYEPMPLDIRIGINHRLKGLPLLANFSFTHLADYNGNFFDRFMNFSIGGELYLGKYVQARLGYDNFIRRYTAPEGNRKLAGLSAGLGIKAKDFIFDYGIAQVGLAGYLHRFTISLDI